jgi:hypothetical protein
MNTLAHLVCSGAFFVFMLQGLRNRSGPRWLAITGLISVAVFVEDEWINIKSNGAAGLTVLCLGYGSVAAMLLHHAARPRGEKWEQSETSRPGAFAYRVVISAFVFMMAAWFIILQIVLMTGAFNSENETLLTGIAACKTVWPAYALFFLAVILTVYRALARCSAQKHCD